MAKKRIVYLDFIKTLAILIIVTLHNGTWRTDFMANGSPFTIAQFCVRLFCEGVPVFVLLNGFLLFDKPFDAKAHLKRMVKLLIITVLWSFILEIGFALINEKPLTFTGVLTSVLETNIANTNTGVLWFLQKLFVVYLIFPVLKHLYDTHETVFNYLLLVLLISTYSVSFLSMISGIFDHVSILQSILVFLNQYTLTIGTNIYVVYFMLGGYLRKNMDRLPQKTLIAVGGGCAVLACLIGIFASYYKGVTYSPNYNYSQVFLLFTIVGAFLVCSKIPFRNTVVNKALALIGDNTMGIYLLHRLVIGWLYRRFDFPTDSFFMRLGLAVLVFFVSLLITWIIRKIPKLSYIVKL